MLHLRLTVPSTHAPEVAASLVEMAGVAHVAHLPGAATRPAGDLVLADVVRESAHEIVEWLQDLDLHHTGAITVAMIDTVISDAAAEAERAAPGSAADALVWEEVEARARREAELTPSILVLMAIATMIAGIGILLDSPILIIGAMVVGPEYGPLAALCVAAVRRRSAPARRALLTLGTALLAGVVATVVLVALLRITDLAPEGYDLSDRELTAFISHPDALAAMVAVLAGVAGMLALTEARSGTLVGVLVSVTTIPAVANVGVAAAYREVTEMWGAAVQLGVNLVGLVAAGVVTLAVQSRLTTGRGSK